MVKESDPGRDVGHAGSIEVNGHLDIGLFRLALDGGAAHEHFSLSKPLAENAVLLTGRPRLRHCGMAFGGPTSAYGDRNRGPARGRTVSRPRARVVTTASCP